MEKIDYRILVRYLSGCCLPEEKMIIKQWEENNQLNERKLEEYKYLWEKAAMGTKFDEKNFDAEKGWQMLQKQIEKRDINEQKSGALKASYFKMQNKDFKYRLRAVAAVFLAVVLIGYIAYSNWDEAGLKQQAPQMQEIATNNGQRTHITLSDGTYILLNAGSKLRVPNVFKADMRKVYLQGQAYFEVAENPDKPFVIYADGTVVRVLGTAFSVSAYSEDHQVSVVVKQGRVSFKANNKPEAPSAIITRNELARFNERSKKMTIKKVDELSLYLGWINGSLNFIQASMAEVATDLERRYGVNVVFKDPEIKEMVLTAHLKSKMVQNVLDVIAMSLKIDYKLTNNKVIFLNK